jgi:hypothetical protein
MELSLLLPAHRDAVLVFARAVAATPGHDEMELEMQSWSARWRPEALDHYLPQGWSFGAFERGELKGFILTQPYLFHRGLTQTLWVEELLAVDEATEKMLLDTVYAWARDKHFQCVLIEDRAVARSMACQHLVDTPLIEIRSSKF